MPCFQSTENDCDPTHRRSAKKSMAGWGGSEYFRVRVKWSNLELRQTSPMAPVFTKIPAIVMSSSPKT